MVGRPDSGFGLVTERDLDIQAAGAGYHLGTVASLLESRVAAILEDSAAVAALHPGIAAGSPVGA